MDTIADNIVIEDKRKSKIYEGSAARILKYLISGCSNQQAADAVGVDVTYVKSLTREEDFSQQLKEGLLQKTNMLVKIDENYEQVELEMSDKLRQLTPSLMTPKDVLTTLKIINGLTRRSKGLSESEQSKLNAGQAVRLALPQVIINNFTTNINNEVVRVGADDLVTLNSASIDSLAAQHRKPVDTPEDVQAIIDQSKKESKQLFNVLDRAQPNDLIRPGTNSKTRIPNSDLSNYGKADKQTGDKWSNL